jgi:hypothetical protein
LKKEILVIEKEINDGFARNALCDISYSQSIWTILSVLEDMFFKIRCIDKQSPNQIRIWSDIMLNSVTHPLRVLHSEGNCSIPNIENIYIDKHYEWAYDWLKEAREYNEFCTLFPLFHRKHINFSIENRCLNVIKNADVKYEYEAYNRIFIKEGNEEDRRISTTEIIELLMPYVSCKDEQFDIDFNAEIIKKILSICSLSFSKRFKLPNEWKTTGFTFRAFNKVFETIQAILISRMIIRDYLAGNGLEGLGYSSIIWIITKVDLVILLTESTDIIGDEINNIIDLLVFGSNGIRNSDIATQPIIKLGGELLCLAPFIWSNLDGERNLCVLLNKVEQEINLYSKLKEEKESILQKEIIEFIERNKLNYDIRNGNLGSTNLDIAIIDRENKVCMCIELKWFIEPAEVDEIVHRSEELIKGVQQAKEIFRLFRIKDENLLNNILDIDEGFDFCAIVGSRNWIGNFDVQDKDIPIIKVFHLLEKMKEFRNLKYLMTWINERNYLPLEGIDYEVNYSNIEIAN